MLGTLFTIPTSSVVISSAGAYSTDWFTEFLPVIYLVIGLLVAGLAIKFIARAFKGGVRGVLGGRRSRGRRR